MDAHLLRTFVAVAECGSFSAAAAELGYTQSAVSQQIAALESNLGTALLHRRPVVPTPAGERLLEHAGPILLRLDAARADVLRVVGEPPGSIVFGATPLAASPHVARALTELRRSRPGIEVTFAVAGREEVARGVAAGEYHLGLVDGIAAPSDPLKLTAHGTTTAVQNEPLVVALPTDHPLARRRRINLHDLLDARWIDAPEVAAPLPDLRAATETDAIRSTLTYTGTDVLSLLALVAAGHGLAVLPASLTLPGGVAAVPVESPRLVHRTELLHGHVDEPAATTLAAVLADAGERSTG
ncbi:DNA-binding transcriptional LysR family regulator [Kribbella sp. VKM Ac-2527]|uniref:DNA-binding transcriptional LysR family regulator n=1 Tax=Kribbella caucasensis TaxID=2512215 RepID=A0A4R6KMZ2_9ACTN|nr:LysR family transcriptional regulator [Kribbella sp. VKM Ac-2527]TDO51440.1 DNA-binding transcriptional LysR family regulator [Kribbella sp. VKM Ac-2527]